MGTLTEFVQKEGIIARVERVGSNPNMEDSEHMTRHFKITLTRFSDDQRRRMTSYFSQGSAHTEEPTAADLLDCCASDASSIENARSFEEWADEYGYDTDSRKAEKTYRVCVKQTEQLKRFLGEEAYKELLWDTERE